MCENCICVDCICVRLCLKFCCINCVGNKNWVLKRFNGTFCLTPSLPPSLSILVRPSPSAFHLLSLSVGCETSYLTSASSPSQMGLNNMCLYKAFWLCQFCIFILRVCGKGAAGKGGRGRGSGDLRSMQFWSNHSSPHFRVLLMHCVCESFHLCVNNRNLSQFKNET